jgi:hypothetical protein
MITSREYFQHYGHVWYAGRTFFAWVAKQNDPFGCLEGLRVVAQPVLKAPSGQALEERLYRQFPAGLSLCRAIFHALVQRLHA